VKQQHGQHRSRLRPAKHHNAAVDADLDRTEHAELHGFSSGRYPVPSALATCRNNGAAAHASSPTAS